MQPTSNSAAYALMYALEAVIACMHTQSLTHGWEGFSRREADSARRSKRYSPTHCNTDARQCHGHDVAGEAT
jgi:hypothetical protein